MGAKYFFFFIWEKSTFFAGGNIIHAKLLKKKLRYHRPQQAPRKQAQTPQPPSLPLYFVLGVLLLLTLLHVRDQPKGR